MITQHRTVMHVDTSREDNPNERNHEVWFTNVDEGDDDATLFEEYCLDWDVWTRMHKPHEITLTVVPGDTLNEDPAQEAPTLFAQENLGGTKMAD